MSTYTNITTALGLMLIGMPSPGLAAENQNDLLILISGSPTAHTTSSKALQQQATDIIIAKLAADGHRLDIADSRVKSTRARLHNVSLTPLSKRPDISINVRARLKIISKTYTRHASLHLHTVTRNVKRGTLLSRLRASTQSWRIPENCDTECVADSASEQIWEPARQIAKTIARKLKNIKLQRQLKFLSKKTSAPRAPESKEEITIRLIGFDSATIRDIEDYLIVIPGNGEVRRNQFPNSDTSFSIVRKKAAPPLQPHLQKMLAQIGTSAALTQKQSQFTLNARSQGKPGTSPINW